MIVLRFLVTQLHHARRDQNPDTVKHSQRLDRSLRTYGVGIVSIINDRHETVFPHLHTMGHRLDPAYRDPQFLQRHTHFMSDCDSPHHIDDIVGTNETHLESLALAVRGHYGELRT